MTVSQMLFSIEGRIRRSHYWVCSIVLSVVSAFVYVLCVALYAAVASSNNMFLDFCFFMFSIGFFLILMWMNICILVKRWHDRDKSGWFHLIVFIPVIGPFWAFIELGFLDGTQGENSYGPSPKGISTSSSVFS